MKRMNHLIGGALLLAATAAHAVDLKHVPFKYAVGFKIGAD